MRVRLVVLALLLASSCTSIVVMPIELPDRARRAGGGDCQLDKTLIDRIVQLEKELAAAKMRLK